MLEKNNKKIFYIKNKISKPDAETKKFKIKSETLTVKYKKQMLYNQKIRRLVRFML